MLHISFYKNSWGSGDKGDPNVSRNIHHLPSSNVKFAIGATFVIQLKYLYTK